ncbi:MAG: homoserine kinase [Verrucomicrobiales bacterium]|jgi:homoserine kinase
MQTPGLGYAVVRVPGSTSNIGPGFDCMGIALQIYNHVRVERLAEGTEGEDPAHTMVASTAARFFAAANTAAFPLKWTIEGEVPISRGLGSSVTLRQGILQGLNALCGDPLDRDALFRLGAELEGHPDNASAGVYGGFTCNNAAGTCLHHPVHERLKFLVLIPECEVLTEASRGVLPDHLPYGEAVASLGNACVITSAFASQNYEALRGSFVDHFHQPYRETYNPGLNEVIAASEAAGALGGFLSGSGSTIACLALAEGAELQAIGSAMQKVYQVIGKSRVVFTEADNAGARTVELGG